jgi:hypothetical protein
MAKQKLNTRKHLNKYRAAKTAEREAERKADAALQHTPRKWKDHTREMRKMMEGLDGPE